MVYKVLLGSVLFGVVIILLCLCPQLVGQFHLGLGIHSILLARFHLLLRWVCRNNRYFLCKMLGLQCQPLLRQHLLLLQGSQPHLFQCLNRCFLLFLITTTLRKVRHSHRRRCQWVCHWALQLKQRAYLTQTWAAMLLPPLAIRLQVFKVLSCNVFICFV